MTFDPQAAPPRARLGFLQVRPMVASDASRGHRRRTSCTIRGALLASEAAMGNGVDDDDSRRGVRPAGRVRADADAGRGRRHRRASTANWSTRAVPYLLIGFGRWGSSHPTLGIPVNWSQIAGARAIVEATLPSMNVEPSQGSHFFHNLSSFQVSYFTVPHDGPLPDRLGLARRAADRPRDAAGAARAAGRSADGPGGRPHRPRRHPSPVSAAIL